MIFSLIGFLGAFWIEFSYKHSSFSKPIDLSKPGIHQFIFKPLLNTGYKFYISALIDVSSQENFESFKKKAEENFQWDITIENQRNKSILFKHAGGIREDITRVNQWTPIVSHYYDSNKEPLIITVNVVRPYPVVSSPQGLVVRTNDYWGPLLVITPLRGKEMFLLHYFLLFVSPIPGVVGLILLIVGLRLKEKSNKCA